ncbi:Wadjet anti-phage system protein JetD domain-containing protein [Microvirga massiliensis]|uniref:Wadjet anti-phage system protein JetD domain-containing protein n=1 Tax=Microvirga massiliensis TaxID=1033741 RepID=UPI00062B399A|nr:Wadjet anti-phage system protein JetD domain-containing protein [Microvirga massiliensis]
MGRSFPTAEAALHDLLDRLEGNPSATRLLVRVDRSAFPLARDADEFEQGLKRAAETGAVTLKFGVRRDRGTISHASLRDPDALYRHLGRRPSSERVREALDGHRQVVRPEWQASLLGEIESAWSRNRDWYGIPEGDTTLVDAILRMADAIGRGDHEGLDYRTFSRRIGGASKIVERHEAALLRAVSFVREVPAGKPREALSAMGLDKVSIPFHVSGPVALEGTPISPSIPYVAIPHEAAGALSLSRRPRVVLTIENFVSFHRHAIEANRKGEDLVIYTAGQPSLGFRKSMAALLPQVPADVPRFHWSDIDAGGIEVFKTMERMMPGLRPHLMSRELAETRGSRSDVPITRPRSSLGSAVASLSDYLSGESPFTLEQEELDPERPDAA